MQGLNDYPENKAGTGEPNFVYEVKWVGYAARENTWEPADNLIGWEAEMRAIDEKYEIRDAQSFVSVAGAAQAAREAAAKQKAAELTERRDRLSRMKRRRAARNGGEESEEEDGVGEDDADEEDAETRAMDDEQLQRELELAEQLLAR